MITKIITLVVAVAFIADLILCLRKSSDKRIKAALIVKSILFQSVTIGSALLWRDSLSQRTFGWIMIIYMIVYLAQIVYIITSSFSKKRKVRCVALLFALMVLLLGVYGVTFGRLSIRREYVTIPNSRTNSKLEGFRVVQISDLHLGTLREGSGYVKRLVKVINDQKPDIVAFTGDIVNNRGDEIIPFIDDLSKIEAKIGVYAVLGNHDYGSYDRSMSVEERREMLERLMANYELMGWRLLNNESERIAVNGEVIDIIGVEHLGGRAYGDLKKAMAKVDNSTYNLLLCHTPEKWSSDIATHYNADLTLSGHTHAMQSKINVLGKSYSLSSRLFEQWSGLYSNGDSYLYVNDGAGCVGIPIRIGVRPEVTIFDFEDI